jgi:hypothetical protein
VRRKNDRRRKREKSRNKWRRRKWEEGEEGIEE